MQPPIGEPGMRIMRLLIGHPPRPINELEQLLNVTRNAVNEQLEELIDKGYVVKRIEPRKGAPGRPRYLYSATDQAMINLFEGNEGVVVPAVWRAIDRHAGKKVLALICRSVAEEVAKRFLSQMNRQTSRERMQELADLLNGGGRLVEFQETNLYVEIRKYNCPFISMKDETGTLCQIHLDAMGIAIGESLKLVACRNEGSPCCTFRLFLSSDEFFGKGDGI